LNSHFTFADDVAFAIFYAVVIVGLTFLFLFMRRFDTRPPKNSTRGFSPDDLTKLQNSGKVSGEELRRLAAVIAAPMKKKKEILATKKLRPARYRFCPDCGYDLRATPDRCPECGGIMSSSGNTA
jgi:predicted Zn-ribbon and HTH transcriptional regulator